MRLSWKLCSPSLSRLLQRRVSERRTTRRTVDAISNKPITKVQTIIIKATSKHPALQKVVESFSDLHLRGDVVDALNSVGLTSPTATQMLTIPHILRGKNVLCAAETGSGKTLAYLAPIISQLRKEEAEEGVVPRLRRPRALILVPSRDLALQVLAVAKSLCHVARFRAVGLIRGGKKRNIRSSLVSPVDVAITTPDALLGFRRKEQIQLTDVRYLVVDEVDTMLDQSFQEATTSIIKTIKAFTSKPPTSHHVSSLSSAKGAHVIAVAATLSTQLLKKFQSLVPDVKVVTTKSLHRILPHIEQRFYKITQAEKADKLLAILRGHPNDVFMVFCNTISSCDWTSHFLKSNGVPVTKLHAGFRASSRKHLIRPFCEGETRVLVCTDLASRGIDYDKVTHVVLFDFPNTIADYLHRVGRTGRVSSTSKCRASILMNHRKDVRIAWEIKDAADRRDAIMNQKMNRRLQSHDPEPQAIDMILLFY